MVPNGNVYGIYNAQYHNKSARLTISDSSILFEYVHDTALPIFDLRYDQINNVEKKNEYVPSLKDASGKHLRLVSRTDQEFLVENLDERDMAFSQIVGLSDWTWQVVW